MFAITKYQTIYWDWLAVFKNPALTSEYAEKILDRYEYSVDSFFSHRNCTVEFFKKYLEKSQQYNRNRYCSFTISNPELYEYLFLSKNKNFSFQTCTWGIVDPSNPIPLTFFEKHLDHFKDGESPVHLSRHPSITWEFVKEHPDFPWKYGELPKNPNITLEHMREKPEKSWNITAFSSNPNIDITFVLDNIDKLDLKEIANNPAIHLKDLDKI